MSSSATITFDLFDGVALNRRFRPAEPEAENEHDDEHGRGGAEE